MVVPLSEIFIMMNKGLETKIAITEHYLSWLSLGLWELRPEDKLNYIGIVLTIRLLYKLNLSKGK